MFDFLDEWQFIVIGVLYFASGAVILFLFVWHVWNMRRLVLSTQEQAEVSQRPVLIVGTSSNETARSVGVESLEAELSLDCTMLESGQNERIVIRNIGLDPALNISWSSR